jgi:hypothetical protein
MKKFKTSLLIISLIFFFNIFLLNSFATLYIIKDPEGDFTLITNLENIMLKYQLLDYKISIVKESSQKPSIKSQSIPESKPKPEPKIKSKPEPTADIKIVDWTNYISETGNYIYVEGIIQNTSKTIATDVRIKIQALDKYDKLISITSGYTDPSILATKQKATFSVMVTNNPKISKFNLTVLWK